MAKRADLEPLIIREWLQRQPQGQRKTLDVLTFCGRLQQENSPLLKFRQSGDMYQTLKTILRDHIED